jgi:hypothetical protein
LKRSLVEELDTRDLLRLVSMLIEALAQGGR